MRNFLSNPVITRCITTVLVVAVLVVSIPAPIFADEGGVSVSVTAGGEDDELVLTDASQSFTVNVDSSGATACQLNSPDTSGISLSASMDISPGHEWYPTPGGSVGFSVSCTDGTTSVTDGVTVRLEATTPPPPPTGGSVEVEITANGAGDAVTINQGDSYTYSWNSTGATACQLTSPDTSGISLAGTSSAVGSGHPWYPTPSSPVTLTIVCTNGSVNATDSVTVSVTGGAVMADIKANGSDGPVVTINSGDSYTYSWNSTGATACQLTSPDTSGISLAGTSSPIAPGHPWYPTASTAIVLTIVCTNGSTNHSDSVTVGLATGTPGPVDVDLKINGQDGTVTINEGDSYIYSWNSTGATACQLTSPDTSGISLAGTSSPIAPGHPWYPTLDHPVTYTIVCTNGSTNDTDSGVVRLATVTPPPPPPPPPAQCPLPNITSSLTATGTVNQPFSYTLTSSSGVATTTRFSFTGTLPVGLSFATSTGVLSGIPTQAGTSSIGFVASTDCGNDQETLVVIIAPATVTPPPPVTQCPVPTISSSLTASVTVNQSFSYTISSTSTVATTTSFSIATSSLPNGLSFATSTGVISGTPTETGTFNITLSAITDCGIDTRTLILTVSPAGGGGGGGGGSSGGGSRGHHSGSANPGQVLGACIYLEHYMRRDFNNDPQDVIKLQLFLQVFSGETNLPVTGVFDQATFDAVSRFQMKYFNDILEPWGHTGPTGYVYILTLKKINELYCQQAFPLTPGQIQEIISFRAFLESLRSHGIYVPTTVDKEGGSPKEGTGTSGPEDIPIVGVDVQPKGQNENKGQISNESDGKVLGTTLGAVIFAGPHSFLDTMQCIYEFILILIVLYILGSVLENVLYKNESQNARKRFFTKWITIALGLALATVGAYLLNEYCLILPLLIAFVISLIWMLTYPKHSSARASAKSWYLVSKARAKSTMHDSKTGQVQTQETTKAVLIPEPEKKK